MINKINFFFIFFLKRVIKITILYPITFLILLFIRAVRKILLIKTYTFDASSFSHFFSDYHLILNIQKSSKKNYLIFGSFEGTNKFYNKFVYKIIKRDFYCPFFFKYLDRLNRLIPGGNKNLIYNIRKQSSMDLYGFHSRFRKNNFFFTDKENEECRKIALQLGINKKKFVCLNIRDSFFYTNIQKINGDNEELIRNHIKLEDCLNGLKILNENDYQIIRSGRFKKKFKFGKEIKIIDISNNNEIPHIFDIWIYKNCSFAIGNASGPDPFAGQFGKMTVILGFWPIFYTYSYIPGITLPAQARWHHNGEVLTLWDLLNVNYKIFTKKDQKEKCSVDFIGNTSQEITKTIEQAIDIYENSESSKFLDEACIALNNKFFNTFKKWDMHTSKLYNNKPKYSKYNLENFSEHKLQKRFIIYKNKNHFISEIFLKSKNNKWFDPYYSSK